MDIDLEQLRALMRAIDEFGVQELEIEREGERVVLRRGPSAAAGAPVVAHPVATAQPMPPGPPSEQAPPPSQVEQEQQEEDENAVFVTSPFVGTFYRSPSPGAKPFVKEGSDIEPGQTLCIVEAMKLMNEIEAELSGTILEILADNGKPVEYGDRLFKVRPKS